MHKLLTLLLILASTVANSQHWQWIDYLQGGSANHAIFDVHAGDEDNFMYACGRYRATATFYGQDFDVVNPYHAGYRDVWLAKIDSAGNFVWVITEGGPDSDFANGITTDELGNVYITGTLENTAQFDTISVVGDNLGDVFVAKYNANGEVQWVKVWGGVDWDWGDEIVCDRAGHIYVGGYQTGQYDYGLDTLADFGYFIQKMDYDGNIIWCKGPTNQTPWSSSVLNELIYYKGDLYFGGGVEDDIMFGSVQVNADNWGNAFMAKMDTSGNVQWVHNYGSVHYDMTQGLAIQDSIIYMCGSYASYATFDTITKISDPYPPASGSAAYNSRDGFVGKFTTSGSCIWIRDYKSNNIDQVYSVIINNMGNVVVTGSYDQFDIYSQTASSADLKITEWDPDGNQVWEMFPTGVYMGQGTILDQDVSGNYMFGGRIKGDYTFEGITINATIPKFTGIMARIYPTLELSSDTVVSCSQDTLWLKVPNSFGSPLTYNWSSSGGNILVDNGDSAQVVMSGMDSAYCIVSNGFESDTLIFIPNFLPQPSVDLGPDIETCDSIVTLNAGSGGLYFDWSTGAVLNDSLHDVTSSGTYVVSVTNGDNCTSSDSIYVGILDCSGIDEVDVKLEMWFDQNAQKLYVYTDADLFNLSLYTIEGKLVSTEKQQVSGASMDFQNYQSGAYVVVYQDNYGNRKSHKIVKN